MLSSPVSSTTSLPTLQLLSFLNSLIDFSGRPEGFTSESEKPHYGGSETGRIIEQAEQCPSANSVMFGMKKLNKPQGDPWT
jgi:hypothetical protein